MMDNTLLYLKNANMLDVVTGEIDLSNILIENGWISKVEKVQNCEGM